MDVVILAAGYSSRTHQFKLAYEFNGQSLLSMLIDRFYPICDNLIVVGGHYYDAVKTLIRGYEKVRLVKNERYSLGMFSSIQCGVKAVHGDFFIMPGDTPLVQRETLERMVSYFHASNKGDFDLLIPSFGGKGGHPLLFRHYLKDALLLESPESNLRDFKKKVKLSFLETEDEGIHFDIDTEEAFEEAVKIYEKRCSGEN